MKNKKIYNRNHKKLTSQRKAISDAKKGVHVGGIQTMLYSLDVRMEEESFIIHLKKLI